MTFNKWLKQQVDRDDPIGDLARDTERAGYPKGSTLKAWQAHLFYACACPEASHALDEAWQEWRDDTESKTTATTPTESDRDLERAYRRGVHQALAMIGQFVRDTGLSLDVVLPEAIKRASGIRGSRRDYPMLMHTLLEDLEKHFGVKQEKTP